MFIEPAIVRLAGVKFSLLDRKQAAKSLLELAKQHLGGYVCVTGAHGLVHSQDDKAFAKLLNRAAINCVDGQPAVWLLRWKGFKQLERVTGRELLRDLVALDPYGEIRHVLFGSTKVITDQMIGRLREQNSRVRIDAAINPPFGEIGEETLRQVNSVCDDRTPTVVWVGLSTPKQEAIASRLSQQLPWAVIVAVGAGFDFVAGSVAEAPSVVTKLGLEWLFRLASDPRRLWRRYADVVPRFLVLAFREISGRHPRHLKR